MMQLYRSFLYILTGVMLAIICTGCASKEARDYSNQYNAETDAPYHLLWQGENQRIVEVDNSYYFLNANYIYYRGKLYSTTGRITNPETELAPFDNYYRYDLENKGIQKMFTDEEGTSSGYINGIKNNTIIYSLFNGDLLDPESWQVRTVTLENQNPQKLDLNPSFLSFYYWHDNDPYLYSFPVLGYDEILDIETKNELTVYDDQYHIVDVIPTPNFNVRTTLYVGNKDHMFAYTKEGEHYKWYILDKKTIESGNAAFQEWISTPSVNFSYFIQH